MLISRQDGERRGLVLLVSRPLQRHLPSLSTCQLLQPRPSQLAQVLMIMKQVLMIIKQVLMIMKCRLIKSISKARLRVPALQGWQTPRKGPSPLCNTGP